MSKYLYYINNRNFDLGAENSAEAAVSSKVLQQKLDTYQQQLSTITHSDSERRAELQLASADVQIQLGHGLQAWKSAFSAFETFADNSQWEQTVCACDTLFRSNQPGSLAALGHAVWLSVTFPVDPALTVSQLQHIIDETPDNSDGAAVAAVVAAYVVDLRRDHNEHDDVTLAVSQMMSRVAREHSAINNQEQFDDWCKRLELDQPTKFLPRLRNIIDVLVQDDWWLDRDALQAKLPN